MGGELTEGRRVNARKVKRLTRQGGGRKPATNSKMPERVNLRNRGV